ncbi:MAG: hypothetical protein ACRD0E_06445, partial [Acidimicrobiales bacterium]
DQVTSGDPVVNAVQVTTSSNQTFGFVSGNQQVAKTATAMRAIPDSACSGCAPAKVTSAISGFTIGSYLASVNTQASVLGGLLGPLGTNLSLSALGYQGLASTDITLADLVGADASLGTVNGLLGAKFPPGTLLSGVGSAITQKIASLTASGQPIPTGLVQAQHDINAIAAGITSGTPLTVCQLFNSGSLGPNCTYQPGSVGNMNLLALVTGIIELADGQSALNLGGGIPGLLSLGISAIQPPQIALPGPINVTKAKTSQATVTLGLGLPLLLTANVKVVAAGAQGTLTGITCTTPVANSTTKIHVDTQGATATLSVGLQVPLLGNIPVLSDTGSVATTHQDLNFHGPFNDSNLLSTSDASLGISWDNPQVLSGLIPLPAGSIINLVGSALLPVLGPVLDALGVNLAGADVVNNYLNCGLPILVKTK